MTWQDWLGVTGGVVGLASLIAALVMWHRLRRVQRTARRAGQLRRDRLHTERAAFVVNPSKHGVTDFKRLAAAVCEELGLGEPAWFETTVESPGMAQAATAAKLPGVTTVVAAGGDGTVRAVAAGLAGGDVPMGIVPLGTANLLARNLGLPLLDHREALEVALTGARRAIDIGRLNAWEPGAKQVLHAAPFLVIAGLGFDAALVSDAASGLKARLGWPAYFVSGFNHLADQPIRVHIMAGGRERQTNVRAAMFGNCGLLPAGLRLAPDADLSDGLLDLVTVQTRHGLLGWAALAFQVAGHSLGLRGMPRWSSGRLRYQQYDSVRVVCDDPQRIQLDGELAGWALALEAWVDHLALTVRVRGG